MRRYHAGDDAALSRCTVSTKNATRAGAVSG